MSTRPLPSIFINVLYLLNLIGGLSFQVYIAARYGASHAMDVFIVTNTIVMLFIASIVSSLAGGFIPLFTRKQKEEKGGEWRFSGNSLATMAAAATAMLVALYFAAPFVLPLALGRGREAVTGADVLLLVLQGASIPLTIMSQVIILSLNCVSRFLVTGFSSIVNVSFMLGAAVMMEGGWGITSLGIAVMSGALAQLLFLLYFYLREMRSADAIPWPVSLTDKSVYTMMAHSSTLMLAFMLFKVGDLVERGLANSLGEGYVSYIGYSYRLLTVGSSLLSVGLITTAFPALSRMAAENNMEGMRIRIVGVLKTLVLVLIPITVWFFGEGDLIIRLFFQRGQFTAHTTAMVFQTMKYQVGILWFSAVTTLFTQVLYSFKEIKKVLMIAAVGSTSLILLKYAFMYIGGFPGLAVSTTVNFIAFTVVLYVVIERRIGTLGLLEHIGKERRFATAAILLVAISFFVEYFVMEPVVRIMALMTMTALYGWFVLAGRGFFTPADDLLRHK